jgi:alpha-tubulin suppressor-like RCC1 family protein
MSANINLVLLTLAACVEPPATATPDVPDAGAPIECDESTDCPGAGDAICSCGDCAIHDDACDPSGLRYSVTDGGDGDCVPAAEELALGLELSCVRWTDGRVSCWGRNCNGQLGDGSVLNGCNEEWMYSNVPRTVLTARDGGAFTDVVSIGAGYGHVCALRADGTVWCWGESPLYSTPDQGTIGGSSSTPVQVNRRGDVPLTGIEIVAVGGRHACAIDSEQVAFCWGEDDAFQLGRDSSSGREDWLAEPIAAPGRWSAMAAGGDHTCATSAGDAGDDRLQCWGGNSWGQVGSDVIQNPGHPAPQQVVYESSPTTPLASTTFALGNSFSCAATSDRDVLCWGRNLYHALGDELSPQSNNGVDARAARPIALELPATVEQIAGGDRFACARLANGELFCWGDNRAGQLGVGLVSDPMGPTRVALDSIDIAGGIDHMCAITPERSVLCWGANARGQLGDGTERARPTPTEVVDLCP